MEELIDHLNNRVKVINENVKNAKTPSHEIFYVGKIAEIELTMGFLIEQGVAELDKDSAIAGQLTDWIQIKPTIPNPLHFS